MHHAVENLKIWLTFGATITQALDFLEKRDYIFKDENGRYNVLDPLIKCV